LSELLDAPVATADAQASTTLVGQATSETDTARQQRWVTNWLSKRYHVAADAANLLVSASYATAKETKLDPLLILAVMSIESGLNPFAESAMGAQGLMQVMSKVHHDKFDDMGGVKAALNPVANIKVGALILKDYVTRGGSVEAGLKLYVGAAANDNDAGYGSKVLAEYHRLKDVSTGKNVPTFNVPVITTVLKPHQATDSEQTANSPTSAAIDRKQADIHLNQIAAL
jgi:soluble lytic murein transglycosylase-like protein